MLSSVHNNIGVCHFRREQAKLAEQAFNDSIKYNSIAAARINLATILDKDLFSSTKAGLLKSAELYFDVPGKAHQ